MIEIIPLQKPINVNIGVPGSKSYTNRALLLAALAEGKSEIHNPLESDDTKYMASALSKFGIKIKKMKDCWEVFGTGGKFKHKKNKIFLGNAGTAVRFLTAACTLQNHTTEITGDQRMQERPIKDLIDALARLGAQIESKSGYLPLKIKGGINGGKTTIKADQSSQYLSALLMVAPLCKKEVEIQIAGKLTSLPYLEMTLEIMEKFGVKIINKKFNSFLIKPHKYKSTNYKIESDASSATYFAAIAALNESRITLKNLSANSKQADLAFFEVIKKIGCKVEKNTNQITVTGTKKLKPLGVVNLSKLPDAAMTVAILAAFAQGKSTLKGLHTLRIKETDRIKALATELRKMGTKVKEGPDCLEIDGDPDCLHGATIDTYNDHRMAMCFAVAGSKIPSVKIKNPNCVSKTYPNFWKDLKKTTVKIKKIIPGNNIILGGLRGTGKTTIGKILAKKIGFNFIDTDDLVEQSENKKIADIVKNKGWKYFRKKESEICKKIATLQNYVIATGGGIFLNKKNTEILKKSGMVIILTCKPELSATRIKGDNNRPALTNQKKLSEEMAKLWQERKNIYLKAGDLFFDTRDLSQNPANDLKLKTAKIINLIANSNLLK